MRSSANSGGGWADEWTAALEGRGRIVDAAPGADGDPCRPDGTDADGSRGESLLPHRMHYCSAGESDEWAAVLGRHDAAADAWEAKADTWMLEMIPRVEVGPIGGDGGAAAEVMPAAVAPAAATTDSGGAAVIAAALAAPAVVAAATGTAVAVAGGGAAGSDVVVLFAAIELGSHCTRAVIHDGASELARLMYDTMLGQSATPAAAALAALTQPDNDGSGGGGGSASRGQAGGVDSNSSAGSSSAGGSGGGNSGDLHPEAVDRTLEALRRIMAAAAAAAEVLAAMTVAGPAASAAGAAVGADVRAAAAAAAVGAGEEAADLGLRLGGVLPAGALSLPAASWGQQGQQQEQQQHRQEQQGPTKEARLRLVGRMVATAAVRGASASSRAELAAAAEGVVGFPLEVLSGEEEGRLAWNGVVGGFKQGLSFTSSGTRGVGRPMAPSAAPESRATAPAVVKARDGTGAGAGPEAAVGAEPGADRIAAAPALDDAAEANSECRRIMTLVVDLGGRSTEFIYGAATSTQPPSAVSLQLGCVSLHATAVAASFHRNAAAEAASVAANGSDGGATTTKGRDGGAALGQEEPEGEAGEEAVGRQAQGDERTPSLEGLEACVELARQTVLQQCTGEEWLPAAAPQAAAPLRLVPVAAGTTNEQHHPNSKEAAATFAATPTTPTTTTTFIFTGGTVTTLAALHQQLPTYERTAVHGSFLSAADLRRLMAALAAPGGLAASGGTAAVAAAPDSAAAALAAPCGGAAPAAAPGGAAATGSLAATAGAAAVAEAYGWLTAARARTLAAGCAGLLGVMEVIGAERVAVSDADLLDGLLEEVLKRR